MPKNKNEKVQLKELPKEIIEDPNISPVFDVDYYRELFMSIREKLDKLYDKREKSEKDSNEYDDAVYNLTTNALSDAGAQDFLSYCYKKGKYDFCLMNYEKYMKWLILAASNGNAFSISKLQIFFTNGIEDLLTLEGHDYMLDFLGLTVENYYMFLSKLIAEEMIKNLNISNESLVKMPEVYQEQNEDLLRLFDNSKMEAVKNIKQTLKTSIDELSKIVKSENKKEVVESEKIQPTEENKEVEYIKEKSEENKEENKKTSNPQTKKPAIKKFRW